MRANVNKLLRGLRKGGAKRLIQKVNSGRLTELT